MNHIKTPRLKPLLDTVPPGFVVDSRWLRARGIDPRSIHDYVAHGWLEHVIHGVYRRPLPQSVHGYEGDSWGVILLSLQQIMNHAVHLGGESALDHAGHVHYLSFGGRRRVHFYGDVPPWLRRLPTTTQIVVRKRSLFMDSELGIEESVSDAQSEIKAWQWPLLLSSPERAILEALDELPQNANYENLDRIFEGLATLRPERLMKLLDICRSVKVRRLFFVYADRHAHAWREYLDTSKIDFGSGPRALFKNGKYHPTYRIAVPEELVPRRNAAENLND